jgi:anti-sigma B factor antagonist
MGTPLSISEHAVGDVTVLALAGRLVFDDGEREFRDRVTSLVKAGRKRLLVDLENVTYVDSAGVGALVAMLLHVVRRGGDLKLVHPSERAGRVLETAHLLTVFDVFDTEAQAISAPSVGAPGKPAKS